MDERTSISLAEAANWLDVLAVLAGDDPAVIRARFLGADGQTIDVEGILAYGSENSENFRQVLDPSRFAALSDQHKAALERFLRYVEYLAEEEAANTAERERRLLQAIQAYADDHAGDAINGVFAEIFLAIAQLLGFEEEARTWMGIPAQEEAYRLEARVAALGASFDNETENNTTFERGARAARIAESLVGQREIGNTNRGAIVRLVCNGQEGILWCGGFVNYVMNQAMPGIFTHNTYLRARSYIDPEVVGAHNVRGRDYQPSVGDLIVFSRGSGGHVGIVTGINEDGTVSYVAGNDGNAVSRRNFNPSSSRGDFLGYLDVQALAEERGVDVGVTVAYAANTARAPEHDPQSFARG